MKHNLEDTPRTAHHPQVLSRIETPVRRPDEVAATVYDSTPIQSTARTLHSTNMHTHPTVSHSQHSPLRCFTRPSLPATRHMPSRRSPSTRASRMRQSRDDTTSTTTHTTIEAANDAVTLNTGVFTLKAAENSWKRKYTEMHRDPMLPPPVRRSVACPAGPRFTINSFEEDFYTL